MPPLKVLVCGATGFIGRNLCERLSARDDFEVTGVWHSKKPPAEFLSSKRLRLVQADLTRRDSVEAAVKGQDVVIHAAAVTSGAKDITSRPHIFVADNTVMNSLLFSACFEQKVRHVVFFSSSTVYAPQAEPVREDDLNYELIEKYFGHGWMKIYNEKVCEFYARRSNTRHTVIRLSNIYGPHDKFDLERSHVFGATVAKVMTATGGSVSVWGAGTEMRDLLYVSDLMDLVELALDRQREPFELVNAGLGKAISIRDLVSLVIAQSGRNLRVEYDATKPTIPFSLAVNVDRARERFGWQPRTTLEEGTRRTLAWYRDHILKV